MSRMTAHECYFCNKPIAKTDLRQASVPESPYPVKTHLHCVRQHIAAPPPKAVEAPEPLPVAPSEPEPEEQAATRVKSQDLRSKNSQQPRLRAVPREGGGGWYDVMDGDKVINPTPVRKDAAQAFVNESNRGKRTPEWKASRGKA